MTIWEIFSNNRCELGEGPLWHDTRNELFWFDINQNTIFSKKYNGQLTDNTSLQQWKFEIPFSAAGIIDDFHLLLAGQNGFYKFDIENNIHLPIQPLEKDLVENRSNDGRVAPDGSFWIGTMSYKNEIGKTGAGKIYSFHPQKQKLHILINSISIPNSICFDVLNDHIRCYWSDSKDKRIYYLEVLNEELTDLKEVDTSKIKIFTESKNGTPDGSVVDSNHYLWNAEWGSGKVVGYDPTGKVVHEINLPISQPTCPAFIGNDLNQLVITSAYTKLSKSDREKEPMAGMTFIAPIPQLSKDPEKENNINIGKKEYRVKWN